MDELAFSDCKILRRVSFRGKVLESIGAGCFRGAGIADISVPSSVAEVGPEAFCECGALRRITFAGDSRLGAIKADCFRGAGLEEITIPKGVTRMEDRAFSGCEKLKRISFQNGSLLEQIGSGCFGDSGLEEFTAPPGLRRIGSEAFSGCRSLRRVALNEGLEVLEAEDGRYDENGAYLPCGGIFCGSGLEEVVLPGTLREVSGPVFRGCDRLRIVWLGEGCTANVRDSVGESVQIRPKREAIIGGVLFWGLHAIRELVIPDGFERVWDYQLRDSGVERVTIPPSVLEICARAFCGCKALKVVEFVGAEAACAVQNSTGAAASLPQRSRLKAIGEDAFRGCNSLRGVTLPDGLEQIGACAFCDSGLERITAPSSVRAIC